MRGVYAPPGKRSKFAPYSRRGKFAPPAYTNAAGISPHMRRNRTQAHAHMRLPLPSSCSLRICDRGAAYAQAQMRLRRILLCSVVLGRSANLLAGATCRPDAVVRGWGWASHSSPTPRRNSGPAAQAKKGGAYAKQISHMGRACETGRCAYATCTCAYAACTFAYAQGR